MNIIIRKMLYYILLIFIAIWITFPFIWTFLSSIKSGTELYTRSLVLIPEKPDFSRYLGIITGEEKIMASPGQIVGGETLRAFKWGMINSLIVSGFTTLICLIVGSFAAYSFARLKYKGRNLLFSFTAVLRFLPVALLIIPLYLLLRYFSLLDTLLGLIFIYTSFTLPLVIWIMKTFFESLPTELEDAARIDGCGEIGILFRIILPLSLPGLTAAGLLAFIMAYQEFLFALVCTTSLNSKTLPLIMAEFFGRHGMDYGMVCTGAILGILPPFLLALFSQKYIIQGLLAGAIKR
jgi:multiple sugar transport system permease protein